MQPSQESSRRKNRRFNPVPFRDREYATIQETANFTAISPSRIYELLDDETLDGTKIRGRRLVKVASVLKLLEGDRAPKAAA